MITRKIFWKGEEIVIFDRGKNERGRNMWRFYRKSNVPEDAPWDVIDNPGDDILFSIASYTDEKVIKQYYVTPPDEREGWMEPYAYLPSGYRVHCEAIQ